MKPSEQIDNLITSLTDWRGPMLSKFRKLIHEADPKMKEEWKYMGSPCWYHEGSLIATGNAFKDSVKIGFLYGASLPDPDKAFNDELGGNQRRAIKLSEGGEINEEAFKTLYRAAVEYSIVKKAKQ